MGALDVTVESLVRTRQMVLVTGKGGTGKTLVSAALARLGARLGRRAFCAEISSDPEATSRVADAFGVKLTGEVPREVAPNLRVGLVTPSMGHRRFLEDVLPVRLLADAAMRSGALKRFLAAAPAFAEMGVLYGLMELANRRGPDGRRENELLVVDLPATGHALALAQVPDALFKLVPTGPVGEAVKEGLLLLRDPARTASVVVTLLEPLPVSESLELVQGVLKHGIPVNGIIANRVVLGGLNAEQLRAGRAALDGLPPLLGARLFGQLERSRQMLDRLGREFTQPLALLEELPDRGAALVESAAGLLGKASFRTPAAGGTP
ncbi:MAG: hypothetical protein RL653_1685 [Pseudomonadota bacterium]|jgi:anion-transporting  ArsA/GET3 family ATPase